MSYRTKALLEEWVREFQTEGHQVAGALEVIAQDGSDGSDTGLVVVRLESISNDLYMQPVAIGNPHWEVTIVPFEADLVLSPQELLALNAELAITAALCTFLEHKSQEHDDQVQRERSG
ncbi:hypothetical protein SCB71_08300 [Herbiconiux sp. KACC 21604]|uniref:hypothetical protein n=1 Tax=unclassified Herbiconiux TaxID=2618217 RepID=UPI001490FB2B|nr:hypothetical protein [Herbiconiux sp. SALV-R1]QJU53267.1 hypothetical protein HL652_06265 [Herbiconiux sp. SALV-R1]WPO88225.1 hypothetical protein SCB71_08300 [Herbiconiux sp. KACC 21604]